MNEGPGIHKGDAEIKKEQKKLDKTAPGRKY
jgi:hypothetical protein